MKNLQNFLFLQQKEMSEEEESKLPLLKWDVDANVEGGVIWPW